MFSDHRVRKQVLRRRGVLRRGRLNGVSDLSQAIDAFDRAQLDRDADLAGTVLDPDFSLVRVQPTPSSQSREEWLALLPDYVVHDYEVVERFVHERGDTAAVLQQVRQSTTVSGQDIAGLDVVTDVWLRTPSGWRLWRRHLTPVAVDSAAGTGEGAAARMSGSGTGDGSDPSAKATVSEIAAVLATIADAGQDPAELTPADMEQYVEAFRALKHQGEQDQ
jgi:ketosteroid isomerase-like protein